MIIIAYDDLDVELGHYFTSCADELIKSLPAPLSLETNQEVLSDVNLNSVSIELLLEKINDYPFILSAFCHGTKLSLNAQSLPFLKSRENTDFLKNGIIYTNACSAAVDFGLDVIKNGAITFVGYNKAVDALVDENFLNISVRCDNYALHLFIHGGRTMNKAVEEAKDWFTTKAKEVLKVNRNPFVASKLIANKNALTIIGNEEIKFSDYFAE